METTTPISTLEFTKRANIVVRAVIRHDDKYLVVQEGKPYCYGKYAFVGGKLDMGEFLADAVVREIKEETEVVAKPLGIIGVRHSLWEDGEGFTVEFFFLAEALEIPETFPTSKEIIAVHWKTVEELESIKAAGEFRNTSQEAVVGYLREGKTLPLTQLKQDMTGSLKGASLK